MNNEQERHKYFKTRILPTFADDGQIYTENIAQAANIIKNGGLVAFPTETVYGLGANAFDSEAASKIYLAKGRPSDNPLIVHISNKDQLFSVAEAVSEDVLKLIDAFCPGPLTVVLKKSRNIPSSVTGGLKTVAVRMPDNEAARALINLSGVPIAAPSANKSGRPSPTEAAHVFDDLNGRIELILDGGSCAYGIESTIIDMTSAFPVILRPGSITREMIEDILGVSPEYPQIKEEERPKAPGMKYKHYAPNAKVIIVKGSPQDTSKKINELLNNSDEKMGVMCTDQTQEYYDTNQYTVITLGDGKKPKEIGASLFRALRELDKVGVSTILSEAFYGEGVADAVMNRLQKAADGNIVEV